MSYPQRPTSASNDPSTTTNNNQNVASSSQQPHHQSSSSSQHSINQPSSQNQAQSPIDWSNFMNFATPPVHNAGPSGNGMRSNSGSAPSQHQNTYGMSHQESLQDLGMVGGNNNHNNVAGGVDDENYQAFAQGIAMSRPSPSQINFRQPVAHRQSSTRLHSQQQPTQSYTQPSPHQHGMSLAPNNSQAGPSRSPGKGKSPANQNPPQSQSDQQQDNTGLTLDADAFTRDIRFQVPQFLSNQVGGAPTFPPGGEAWSGFGSNMFSNDGAGQQLTPGSMFNNAFGLTADGSTHFGTNDQTAMNGFMGDEAWTGWDKDDGLNAMAQNVPTTFYVNPNPSPSVLSNRQQQQQQSLQPAQVQQQAQMQQSSFQQPSRSSATPRQNMGNLQVNTTQSSHQNPGIPVSPHTSTAHPSASPRVGNNPLKRSSANVSPDSSISSSMPTSAIFPQQASNAQTSNGSTSYYVPTVTAPTAATQTASTINIASSSTQPYAPPPNTAALLSGPALPNIVGPSLSDGPGLYSTTGFDMVGVLGRVAARKDPKTVLGPVDLSCSFIVVDIRRYDSPIVYASPTFEALTGYELPQILGRNCRFLQSPEGEVVKGSKRKYTDNVAVAHLKRMLNAGKECQASLINYRRGGIPFINLVTVVPIPWEGTDIVYHVGFQVDLVEQPNAILRNMRDGTYQVNYTVGNPPPPVLRPPVNQSGLGLTQEVLDILGPRINTPGFGQGEEGGKMEWLKMVLENADDFVHVLSLKGLFQYVSPGVRRVLEYEPEDLINKNISDICHPSDIVPLMRELKDSTHAPADGNIARKVHLVFRIRRKSSGYIWIECTGRLHVEAGKGRKAVILSGRAISVPTLPWSHVSQNGGLSETEAWMKVSFEGLILHSTSAVQDLIGLSNDRVVGESIFSLLPSDGSTSNTSSAIAHLASSLRSAASPTTRTATTFRHQLYHHKRNTAVDVISVIYPSKSSEIRSSSTDSDGGSPTSDTSRPASSSSFSLNGQRPTSLVVQIKLVHTTTPSRPVVHSGLSNVFEELETTRGTSWQYELHQLRLLNRRIKDDIATAKAKGAKPGKSKKRKEEVGNGGGGGGTIGGSMGPPPQPIPEQYNAAPRHQLAPGFGLVAPGKSLFYQ